jgi:excisionase family DNA binding protein
MLYLLPMITGPRLNLEEVAKKLKISIVRVRILIREGRLPAEKFGTAYAVREADLKLVAHRPPGRPKGKGKAKGKAKRKVA